MQGPIGVARWLRYGAFITVSAFLFAGPLYRQVLGGEDKRVRSWVMFHGHGRGICEVRYLSPGQGGELTPLNRYALLGYGELERAPRSVQRLRSLEEAERLGRRLCAALPAGDREVRLEARCGEREGWRVVAEAERDLCDQAPTLGARSPL